MIEKLNVNSEEEAALRAKYSFWVVASLHLALLLSTIALTIEDLLRRKGLCSGQPIDRWCWKPRNTKPAIVAGLAGIINALVRVIVYTGLPQKENGDEVGLVCDTCALIMAVLHGLTYIPTPIVLYVLLQMDTEWWNRLSDELGNVHASVLQEDGMGWGHEYGCEGSSPRLSEEEVEGYTRRGRQSGVQMVDIPRLRWTQVQTHNKIGSGATAEVYRGSYDGRECAVKMIFCSELTHSTLSVMMRELALTYLLQDESTVEFWGFYLSLPHLCLVYEFCQRGTLSTAIESLRENERETPGDSPGPARLALAAAKSVAFMHGRYPQVIHRDIKPSNYLVTHDWRVKLADFGEARLKPQLDSEDGRCTASLEMSLVGSPGYMAPELIRGRGGKAHYDEQVDIFSLAMVLWQIVALRKPYEEERFRALSRFEIQERVEGGERPTLPAGIPQEFADIVQQAWADNPADRPTADAIVEALQHVLAEQTKGEDWNWDHTDIDNSPLGCYVMASLERQQESEQNGDSCDFAPFHSRHDEMSRGRQRSIETPLVDIQESPLLAQ